MRRVAFVFLLLLPSAASAQTTGGALVGRVSNERDEPLPAVEISATHVATGMTRTLHSASDGRYRFPALPTGSYELTARLTGFKTITVRKVDVILGVARHVDVRLERTTVKEEVTVTAPVRALEIGPAIGVIVARDLIRDVPLRDRSADELATLAPFANRRLAVPFRETLVDGAISVGDPPLGAIEEMNATTRQYPAEYGRTSGGALLLETRQGTNTIDGDAFALYRNDAQRWQIGAAAGAPIVKDVAHVFAALERDSGENDRAFASVDGSLSARHFVEATFGTDRDHGSLRDVWLAHRALWNETVLYAASGANEIRDSLAGSVDFTTVRHDWTVGGMAKQNAGSGYFVQDQITFRKLVLSAGLRYDRQDTSGGFSPRFGWTYDVNGSGRNLLRGSIGRYLNPDTTSASLGYSWQVNPWVALNIDGLRATQRGDHAREAVAVSGQIMFSTFVSVAGSYTYSDRIIGTDGSRHAFAIAGTIHLPAGYWLSGIGRYRSAAPLAGRVVGTDLRGAKTIEMERVAFDVVADIFNVFGQDRRTVGNDRAGQFGVRLRF